MDIGKPTFLQRRSCPSRLNYDTRRTSTDRRGYRDNSRGLVVGFRLRGVFLVPGLRD